MNHFVIIAPSNLPIPAIKGGGIEQLIQNLIDENEKHKTICFSIISQFDRESIKRQKKYRRSIFYNINPNFFYKIYNFFARFYFLVIKKEFFNLTMIKMGRILSKLPYDKVIIFGNDEQILFFSKFVHENKLIYYQATLMFNNLDKFNYCHKIILGSNHSINQINIASGYKFSKKIVKLQSCVDTDFFTDSYQDEYKLILKKELGLNCDLPIVSYLGRVVKSKGIIVLLEALYILKSKGIEFNLLIIGSLGSGFGKSDDNIDLAEKNLIKQKISQLENQCITTGFISQDKLPLYMSLCDIGVVPSLVEDVSPLAYFQWQSMGKATIVSDAGGIPEFFSNLYSLSFKRGELMEYELAYKLETLIKQKELRVKMGIEALKMKSSINKERYYNDFIDIILN